MPEYNSALEQLHARWRAFAALPAAKLTTNQLRSVDFYLADIQRGDSAESHVRRWITMAHELDEFTRSHGRLPLASAARPRPRTPEQQLVDQLAYQRRPSTRAAMVEYQRARLEALRAFNGSRRTIAGMPGSSSIKHSGTESSGLLVDERPTPRRRASRGGLHTSAHRTEQAPCPQSGVHASYRHSSECCESSRYGSVDEVNTFLARARNDRTLCRAARLDSARSARRSAD